MPAERAEQYTVLPGQTPQGQYILSVLIKRTYNVTAEGECQRAEKDRKLLPADKHYDDPMNTTVEFESDFAPYKLGVDVVCNARVYAPQGSTAQQLTAALTIGNHRREISVFGDRVCRYNSMGKPTFTDPAPFQSMSLRYERAYGGIDIYSDIQVPSPYPRNHLGRGFVVKNTKKSVHNLPLPNLEDPQALLTPENLFAEAPLEWEKCPWPRCFGWYSKYWQPRAGYAGVLPADRLAAAELRAAYSQVVPPEQREDYQKTKLPDMDFRYFCGASPGLSFEFLPEPREVRLENLTPEGEWSFALPDDQPQVGLDVGTGGKEPEVVLHTVQIRAEDRQVDYVWRAAAPYPGPDWLPEMKKMEVSIQ